MSTDYRLRVDRSGGLRCGQVKSTEEKEGVMVTLDDAKRVIAAAEKKAVEIGQPQNIAVADAGGNLIAHERMDGAWMAALILLLRRPLPRGPSMLRRRTWRRCPSLGTHFLEFTPPTTVGS